MRAPLRFNFFLGLIFLSGGCGKYLLRPVNNNYPVIANNLEPNFDGSMHRYRYVYHGLDYHQLLGAATSHGKDFVKQLATKRTSDAAETLATEVGHVNERTWVANRYVMRTQNEINDKGDKFRVFLSHITDEESEAKRPEVKADPKNVGAWTVPSFGLNYNWGLKDGLNFLNSYMLSLVAEHEYENLHDAGLLFHRMGFKDIYFMSSKMTDFMNHRDAQGVVLKNDDAIVIAFRGTEQKNLEDIATDIDFLNIGLGFNNIQLHAGFYKSMKDLYPFMREHVVTSLENRLREKLAAKTPDQLEKLGLPRMTKFLPPDYRPIFFTGHSLGAAIATLGYGEMLFPNIIIHEIVKADNEAAAAAKEIAAKKIDPATGKPKKPDPRIEDGDPEYVAASRLDTYYYFIDPALKNLKQAQMTSLLLKLDEMDHAALTYAQKKAIHDNGYLYDFPAIEYDGPDGSNTPGMTTDDFTLDTRLRDICVFGSPRSGNPEFKQLLETYAKLANSSIIRFENVFHAAPDESALNDYVGDIVTRAPATHFLNYEYAHVGIRAYFDNQVFVPEDLKQLKCEYTTDANEANLNIKNRAFLHDDAENHRMNHYMDRIESYLKMDGGRYAKTGDINLPPEHSCKKYSYDAGI